MWLHRAQRQRGQVTIEVAMLFAFVVTAIVVMANYFKHGMEGGIKSNADSLGTQLDPAQGWTQTSTSKTVETPASITTKQTSTYDQSF